MALFMKQDFTPPLLSGRWFAVKFRPNMLLYSRENIILILESGLLFREDSVDVEQESPAPEEVWQYVGGGKNGWLTRGERVACVTGVAASVVLFPPKSFQRTTLINLAVYLSLPLALRWGHRARCKGSLPPLLAIMRDYLALARRTAACLKEYAALHAQIVSLTSVIECVHTLLCRQQSELSVLLSRASSAVLGNAPWLRGDVVWEQVGQVSDNLMKIHHAFLVVQSTFLKHIAMVHFVPPKPAQRVYKNHNERIYWIHTTVLPHITEEFQQSYDSLDRMYRLLKNSANQDTDNKKLGSAVNDNWIYSEIHTGVAKSCLELKLALNKSNSLDAFLDSCALNKQEIDLDVLNRDMDDIIESLNKCLKTVQNSQLRLKKIQNKNVKEIEFEEEVMVENAAILKIEDREPESKDEVFYFMKTDDDDAIQPAGDLITAPGKKEKETNKMVLCELKRKLGKREDIMRERERQALAKTMPELKHIPEFPRQINLEEFIDKKGYIKKLKLRKNTCKNKDLRIKIKKLKNKDKKYKLKLSSYFNESDISGDIYEANAKLNVKSRLLTLSYLNDFYITKWCKKVRIEKNELDSSGLSEYLSDEPSTVNKINGNNSNSQIKFTKKDLELTPSSSESDLEEYKQKQKNLLHDIRRHRAVRKKNHPNHRPIVTTDNIDESLKPIEYSFGTGMAMASVLQVNRSVPNFIANEEVFIGDGEVSSDSGNDEDA